MRFSICKLYSSYSHKENKSYEDKPCYISCLVTDCWRLFIKFGGYRFELVAWLRTSIRKSKRNRIRKRKYRKIPPEVTLLSSGRIEGLSVCYIQLCHLNVFEAKVLVNMQVFHLFIFSFVCTCVCMFIHVWVGCFSGAKPKGGNQSK